MNGSNSGSSGAWWALLGICLGFVFVMLLGLASMAMSLPAQEPTNGPTNSNAVSAVRAACRDIAVTGMLSNVTCNWYGRCTGYVRSGSGSNATWLAYHGWHLRSYQIVTKTLFLCGM